MAKLMSGHSANDNWAARLHSEDRIQGAYAPCADQTTDKALYEKYPCVAFLGLSERNRIVRSNLMCVED